LPEHGRCALIANRAGIDTKRPHLASGVILAIVCGVGPGTCAHEARAGAAPVQPIVAFDEGFETSGVLRFRSAALNCQGCSWAVVDSQAHQGVRSAHGEIGSTAGESRWILAVALAIPADATAVTLSFWQRYDFEFTDTVNRDGGVLEISSDGGETWTDADANITANGYNGVISATGNGNPFEDRAAWIGSQIEWMPVTANLLPYRGTSLAFRWSMGIDAGNIGTPGGWWIDDIRLAYEAPSPSCAGEWMTVGPYPLAAEQVAVTSQNGTLYAFGGLTTEAVADAYRYSTEDDAWAPLESLPEPRYGAAAVSDGTYIYILGGATNADTTFGTLWRYDPVADSYVTLRSYTAATSQHGAAYHDGTIYRIAGATSHGDAADTETVEAYTIDADAWRSVAPYPHALHGLTAVALDGYVYAVGGVDFAGQTGTQSFRYDPAADVWDSQPIADPPARSTNAAGAMYNGSWIVLGSFGRAALGWSSLANAWRSLDMNPNLVGRSGTGVADGALYFVGGSTITERTDLVQRYTDGDCPPPLTPTPTATAATPTATAVAAACSGDCDSNGDVSIAELIRSVAIALNRQPLSSCSNVDADHDNVVRVGELIGAVNNLLNGCP
jgi:N-acetylneuraminic acid mutarotase